MATIQEIAPAPWRMMMLPASFNGIPYHVEQQSRQSGRRIVLHEYPKRDQPYAEDMGRSAVRYQVTGYLVGPNYNLLKLALVTMLQNATIGLLIDPYLPIPLLCVCERFSTTESRERGGYCAVEMQFTEAGLPGNTFAPVNTPADVNAKADAAGGAAAGATNGVGNAPAGPLKITVNPIPPTSPAP
jgi:prophage DNA circulation protein